MSTETRSPRRVFLDAIVAAAQGVRGGAYKVIRGAVNWTGHDFEANPSAVAIVVDEGELDMDQRQYGALITLELFAKPKQAGSGLREINDDLMERLFADGLSIIASVQAQRNKDGDGAVIAVLPRLRWTEVSDADRGVQGIMWQISVKL